MRRAARIDANHTEIVNALREMGAMVQPLHTVGNGCPDLLVGWRNQLLLVEIKDGAKAPSERRLNDEQVKWHSAWTGYPVYVITDITGAVELIGGNGKPSTP
jgi:Holliday junction resolvase